MSNFWTWVVDTARFQVYILFWYICIRLRNMLFYTIMKTKQIQWFWLQDQHLHVAWKHEKYIFSCSILFVSIMVGILFCYKLIGQYYAPLSKDKTNKCMTCANCFSLLEGEINFDNCCTERHVYMILWYFKRQVANWIQN